MFNPADIVTRGVAHHPPPAHSKQVEISAKPTPEKKERKRRDINLKNPATLVGKPVAKIVMREMKIAPGLVEPPKEVKEEKPKVKRERKPKATTAAKIEEMEKVIAELKKDKASQDEKHAMEIKAVEDAKEKEGKVKAARTGRFPKGSQEAKDYMAAMRAKKGKKDAK